MIIKIFILIVIFFVIIITLRKQESFTINKGKLLLETPNPILNNTNYGIHTKINTNDYNLKYYGPTCINTCLLEHVQKINWEASKENPKFAKENILQSNRENPGENFCFLANNQNSDNSIRDCNSGDCKTTCGNDTYLHCEVKNNGENNFCGEKKINYLSGGAILNKTKCGGDSNSCINKYWGNIETIKNIYDNSIKGLKEKKS